MSNQNEFLEKLMVSLKERVKELNCIYKIEELTNKPDAQIEDVLQGAVKEIPAGWQFPDICQVKIVFGDKTYASPNLNEAPWEQSAVIHAHDEVVGKISVYYTEQMPAADEGPFLKEERKLIDTIADRLGHFVLYHRLKNVFQNLKNVRREKEEWPIILEMLRSTHPQMLMRICRKMTNYLCWRGVKEAERLLEHFIDLGQEEIEDTGLNRPHRKKTLDNYLAISEEIFRLAGKYLSEEEIRSTIQKWIKEERSSFLVNLLENPGAPLSELTDAIERYHHIDPESRELSGPREKGFRVSLIRRLLTDQPQFVNIAKNYIGMNDFFNLLRRVLFVGGGFGKFGGKSSGLILAAQIINKLAENNRDLQKIKTPKTWYIISDALLHFMHHNNLEDVVEQKYKEIWQVRQEYPYIEQVFKNSRFSPDMIKGLSAILDDFKDSPLIVRSSSLLEDRLGSAFAGKYKSLFIANQGNREERLAALMDAIAEVYASTFGPDPIEYRLERGLVDIHEEMGIIIQEVVGKKVGHYYFPAYAGVAFSNNELRWSARIKREDGLVRLVPGLGTRAVDRLSDDYPILVAPGQPGLRVNIGVEEKIHYSPKKIDVINLKTNAFETVEIRHLLKEYGDEYPAIHQIVSLAAQDHLRQPMALGIDFEKDFSVITFEGLFTTTPFLKRVHSILEVLKMELNTPVDIEFASDGEDFYLLQCRPQSYSAETAPASIPSGIPEQKIIFTANRYVSNGMVPDITHIVYVDPQKYSELSSRADLLAVGQIIGALNRILPKRQFILLGPGRWGSRGDIKLGVNVTYSDIHNTAMLIEIARQKGKYTPELSFGTHFFQDLVESAIRYLPLYPDEAPNVFNERFLKESPNILPDLFPEYARLADTVRVIDVATVANGQMLQVVMNADTSRAAGFLSEPTRVSRVPPARHPEWNLPKKAPEDHWRWRQEMAERIAEQIDAERFGVVGFYIFGSAKNATAGPGSDIDVLIHFRGTNRQRAELQVWLEGWSLCLDEINFLRTGRKSGGLLDVHIVTDEDIQKRTSYAVKIGAITDAAQPLAIGKKQKN